MFSFVLFFIELYYMSNSWLNTYGTKCVPLMLRSGIILSSKLSGHKMKIEVAFYAVLFLPEYGGFKSNDNIS